MAGTIPMPGVQVQPEPRGGRAVLSPSQLASGTEFGVNDPPGDPHMHLLLLIPQQRDGGAGQRHEQHRGVVPGRIQTQWVLGDSTGIRVLVSFSHSQTGFKPQDFPDPTRIT